MLRLDRWRRCAVFLPRAMFCRVRWEANDYGTIRWQLMVMQAATPLDDMQCIPGVQPGARLLLHAEGETRCVSCWNASTASKGKNIAAIDVSPAYWRTLGNRLAARLALPEYTAERHAAGWPEGAAMTTQSNTTCTHEVAPHPRSRLRSHRAGGLRRRRLRCAGLGGFRVAAAASDLQPVRQRGGRLVSHRAARPAHRLAATSVVRGQHCAGAAARQAAMLAAQRGCLPTRVPLLKRVGAVAPTRCIVRAGTHRRRACGRRCLPTGWAGRCHPCSFAAASNRASCSC